MESTITLTDILSTLPDLAAEHARTTPTYTLLEKTVAQTIANSAFAETSNAKEALGEFGEIELPYYKMGAVDSLDLFGLDELIIFTFYWTNRDRYKRAADIGANLGLHSIMMSRCSWSVKAYEPDPTHAELLRRNLELNRSDSVELVEAAVSDHEGEVEFVRVLGNTTSSHLAGAKENPYGELERFPVPVVNIDSIMENSDFIKMDAEGQEKIIILGTEKDHWSNTDMIVEVGTEENATAIFDHLSKIEVNAFAQKTGWSKISSVDEMPTSYKNGSLFLTSCDAMPWIS